MESVVTYGLLIAVSLFIMLPFGWLVTSTFRPASQLFVSPPSWIPPEWSLEGYVRAIGTLGRALINSTAYGLAAALLSLVVAVPAAYSLVRYRYRGKRGVTGILLGTQMLPMVLLVLPLYVVYAHLGLYNSPVGLVIAFTGLSVPFSILLLRGYFIGLPPDLEEQAMIDGCSRVGALIRIVLPISAPVLVATLLMSLVFVWNDVLITIFLTSDSHVQTASVVLYNLFNTRNAAMDRAMLFAGGVILTLPIVVLFMFLQRYVVKGITLGAGR